MITMRQAGLRVPHDMALAGFDDIPMARYLDPPFSSVHVDISALGEHATLRLLAAVQNKDTHRPCVETLPTTLVLRRSCGAAFPGRDPQRPEQDQPRPTSLP